MSIDTTHSFYAFTVTVNGERVGLNHSDVESRLAKVKDFDAETCARALKLPNLQKTVRVAIERRLRKLQREPF